VKSGCPFVKYIGTLCRELSKTAEPIELPFWIWTQGGPKEARIMWGAHCQTMAPPGEYQ